MKKSILALIHTNVLTHLLFTRVVTESRTYFNILLFLWKTFKNCVNLDKEMSDILKYYFPLNVLKCNLFFKYSITILFEENNESITNKCNFE